MAGDGGGDGDKSSNAAHCRVAGVAALGIVFGDIGTSPLYTLKTVLDYTGRIPTRPRRSARCR